MKKSLRLIAAALAAAAAMSCAAVSASADKLRNIDGVTYRYSDSGEKIGKYTGWAKSSAGKMYYKDGVLLTSKWIKMKKGKFYLDEKGILRTGWLNLNNNWYYIDRNSGRVSGTVTIDGAEYTFGEKGKWDGKPQKSSNDKHSTNEDVYFWLTNGKHDDIYAGAKMPCGMLVVWSVNGQAEKQINKLFPDIGGIIYMPADYSMTQLKAVREGINDFIARDREAGNMELWSDGFASYFADSHLMLELSQEQYDRLLPYIESLPDKGCINTAIGEWEFWDE